MAASKSKGNAPRNSTSLKSPKRKAVFTPDLANLSKRPRTRRSLVGDENRPQEGIELRKETIDTPLESSPQEPVEATSAEASNVVRFKDVKVPLDEGLVADNLSLEVNVLSDLPANPPGSAENLGNLKDSQKRQGTKAVKAQERTGTRNSEEVSKTARKRVKQEVKEETEYHQDKVSPSKRKRKRKHQAEVEEEVEVPPADGNILEATKRKRERAQGEVEKEEEDEAGEENTLKKVKRKRKTKEEKEAEAMPLAARTANLQMYIGAHVSSAKGVQNAVTNCVHIGGNAFALFLKSQRKWENPPLQDEHKVLFKANCTQHRYDAENHVVPHGSYLVNLAQEDPEKANQAYASFVEDLNRCEELGIKLYNFHPGNMGSSPRPSAIARIASSLNRAHAATKNVKPLLENMAGAGNVIGSTFEDLRDIISLVDDKSRVGVCLDTCHSFAAGYDLRSKEAFQGTLEKFDEVVGMKYLSALHLNDSKAPFASHRDLHQNIGLGFLGLRAFHNVMNEPRFEGLPMVLETPIDTKDEDGKDIEDKRIWAREIKMLEELIGLDAESKDFKAMEKELADKGAEERAKYQDQFERKLGKEKKATEKEKKSMADWLKKGPGKDGGKKKRKRKREESDGSEKGV